MWAGIPRSVHIKINPPNNFTNKIFCLWSYPLCSHFHFIPIPAAFSRLTLAPHSAAHHPPAAAVVVVIAAAAAIAIAVAIDVAAATNVSTAAACSWLLCFFWLIVRLF